MLAGNEAYTAELARHGLACVAPLGARSWWANRICPEFDAHLTAERYLLESVVPWTRDRWNLGPRALAAFGISMGGQGAIRLGFKYPGQFPVVAGVASAFDYHEWYGRGTPIDTMYDSRERCRQDTAIHHVNPPHLPPHVWFACDPADAQWYRGNDRLNEKLSAIGVPHTADLDTSRGGHTWAYFDAMARPAFQFLVDALAKESRRLM
ncbi:esterase [Fimbriiglobus ruber]|uniref:Esterase n=2 Tax=Fimbriiglobus ruber TaxID=1908690 RepID=A0A225E6Y8_9BACT|nr:esterase [Fimbriiglobus ruber]